MKVKQKRKRHSQQRHNLVHCSRRVPAPLHSVKLVNQQRNCTGDCTGEKDSEAERHVQRHHGEGGDDVVELEGGHVGGEPLLEEGEVDFAVVGGGRIEGERPDVGEVAPRTGQVVQRVPFAKESEGLSLGVS